VVASPELPETTGQEERRKEEEKKKKSANKKKKARVGGGGMGVCVHPAKNEARFRVRKSTQRSRPVWSTSREIDDRGVRDGSNKKKEKRNGREGTGGKRPRRLFTLPMRVGKR